MPEGDSLRRAAERVSVLVGQRVAVESPHPRAAALGLAPRLDGRVLERVEAVGKNLLLSFEGGLVLRSHLMMRGRWHVGPVGARRGRGLPWLVLRGVEHEAVLWHGPVLELGRGAVERLGPDVLAEPLDLAGIVARLRAGEPARHLADALLDQRCVAGIGNLWRAEALFLAGASPFVQIGEATDELVERVVVAASDAMKAGRGARWAYGRAGLPCRRCGTPIASRRLGEQARTISWCPTCQPGPEPPRAPGTGAARRGR
ncbi:MAG: DNA-formamidopyrimidine glycosylase family protein [Thermoleophilia bacterium]